MRTAHAFTLAAILAGSTLLSLPANAERICHRDCVGPVCKQRCVERDRDITVGRSSRERDVNGAGRARTSRSEGPVSLSRSMWVGDDRAACHGP